ncbi:MAG: exodeoxyribonuclease VII small subunit [Nitrospinota bacterium]
MKSEKIKFEKALKRLGEIVDTLEGGEMELEKSIEIFEEGIKMTRVCQEHLIQAEKKIEKLVKDNKGQLTTKPLEGEEVEEEGDEPDEEAGQDELPF